MATGTSEIPAQGASSTTSSLRQEQDQEQLVEYTGNMVFTEISPRPPPYMKRGSIVVHKNMAYFNTIDSYEIWLYNIDDCKWQLLFPENPFKDFALVVIDDCLTSVGGISFSEDPNVLLSLCTKEGEEREWSQILPCMNHGRVSAVCVTTSSVLVVIGGRDYLSRRPNLDSVEVMDIENKTWSVVSPIPKPRSSAYAVLHGDMLYVACGTVGYTDLKTSFYACSFSDLLASNNNLKAKIQRKLYPDRRIWRELSDVPLKGSVVASHKGRLLAFGGWKGKPCGDVFEYNTESNSWNYVCQMKTEIANGLAVTFPSDKLVVVGYTQMFNVDFTAS